MSPMTDSLRFAEAVSLQDLSTYIKRARRIQEQGIRLQAVGRVLAAWVPVMTPGSLTSQLPAVLGLRTVALAEESRADVTAELSSISERIARMNPAETELSLPPSRLSVPWAAVTPPRSGWEPLGSVADDQLRSQAASGIARSPKPCRPRRAPPSSSRSGNRSGAGTWRPMPQQTVGRRPRRSSAAMPPSRRARPSAPTR